MRYPLRFTCLAMLIGVALAALFSGVHAQEQTDLNAACIRNAQQLGLATLMYMQDYDEKLPAMTNAAAFQKVTFPYVKNKSVYTCPATQKPYTPNAALSGKLLMKVGTPASTPALWDPKAHSDGKFTVCFLDGHAKRVAKQPVVTTSSHPTGSPAKGK
ncbi:MAG TPA: hypothetical protein VKU00_34200 [Chthonomonadaceae bacterium]|nr:hypothetical protein [Chthonomonadaceae bacterium]